MSDIYKVAGVIVKNRQLLVVRTSGKQTFYAPGGKLEAGEQPRQALQRELQEEIGIRVRPELLEPFGTFTAEAADQQNLTVTMDAFVVHSYHGAIAPSHEIEEVAWVNSVLPEGMQLGSIFEQQVIPKLKSQQLID